MKKLITFLLILCLIFSKTITNAQTNSVTLKNSELYAKAAVLLDGDSGRILYDKNGEEQLPMASTTKIMTCILALENANEDTIVEVSDYVQSMPDVQMNMVKGERYKLMDLLYAMMLESDNDAAAAVAECIGQSKEQFAVMMNQKAEKIGCSNTYYITPNGLDEQDKNGTHSTTASDLALVLRYCIKESPKAEEFKKITETKSYTFHNVVVEEDGSVQEGNRVFSCNNHNGLFSIYSGTISGKTGFTGDAGYCYVGAVEDEGRTFIVALLACGWPNNKSYKWSDCRKLIEYGKANYHLEDLKMPEIEELNLSDVLVEDGIGHRIGQIPVLPIALEDLTILTPKVLLNKNEKVEVKYQVMKSVKAPVKKGSVIGSVQICVGDQILDETDLIADAVIERIDLKWCIKIIFKYLIL